MNNLEIKDYLSKFKQFADVYPRDMLPKTLKKPCGIVNTDISSNPGIHWVAIYFESNGTAEYVDSFGVLPSHREILKYLKNQAPNGWSYNQICFQSLYSNTCGMYSVLYLSFRFMKENFGCFASIFTHKKDLNDRIMKILYTLRKKAF